VVSNASLWLNLLINSLLPVLVALVTAQVASARWKSLLLLALSAISGFLTAWLDAIANQVPFDWSSAGLTILSGFIVAYTSHAAVFSPGGLTGSSGFIQRVKPGGLGAPRVKPTPHRHEAA